MWASFPRCVSLGCLPHRLAWGRARGLRAQDLAEGSPRKGAMATTGHRDGRRETSCGCVSPSEGGPGTPGGGGLRRSRRPRLNGRKVILSRKEILSVPILRTAPLSGTKEFSCLFLLSYFHPVMKHINQKGSNIVFFKLLVSANWNIRFAEI